MEIRERNKVYFIKYNMEKDQEYIRNISQLG